MALDVKFAEVGVGRSSSHTISVKAATLWLRELRGPRRSTTHATQHLCEPTSALGARWQLATEELQQSDDSRSNGVIWLCGPPRQEVLRGHWEGTTHPRVLSMGSQVQVRLAARLSGLQTGAAGAVSGGHRPSASAVSSSVVSLSSVARASWVHHYQLCFV